MRELLLGWHDDVADPLAYLVSLGLDVGAATWMRKYIDAHGHLLRQWGVDSKVARLINKLHDGSWFSMELLRL